MARTFSIPESLRKPQLPRVGAAPEFQAFAVTTRRER
jgi:hypothetical protein